MAHIRAVPVDGKLRARWKWSVVCRQPGLLLCIADWKVGQRERWDGGRGARHATFDFGRLREVTPTRQDNRRRALAEASSRSERAAAGRGLDVSFTVSRYPLPG